MTGGHITVPEHALPAAISHEPTRRWLTTAGVPGSHELMCFPRLADGAVVTVARLVEEDDDPADLDPYIARLVAVGQVLSDEYALDDLVLDGATGRVFTLRMSAARFAEVTPLAPSLEALVGILSAVDELTSRQGRFADLAERTGAGAVEEATARLLTVVTDQDWGDDGWGTAGAPAEWEHAVPPFWHIAALFRPMPLIAGPGRGLRLDLPKELLEEEFGPGSTVRLAAEDLPAALRHAPTRRFLTEVGLPKQGGMFLLEEPDTLLDTLTVDRERSRNDPRLQHLYDGTERLPADSDHLLVLGGLTHDLDVVLDGRTGEVHYMEYDADTVIPVNADISTLAFTIWMHSREEELEEAHDLTGKFGDFYHQLAATMVSVLASVDPVACVPPAHPDDYRYWPEVFHDEAGGVL
ncbi:SUKH-4 family immunity protein [Streptomyces sp. RTd22]|uniref:SUKH-4 family immunity protein n=1 Tax=Streptomyces sp. RTd22 TaxID=1841249 RepID=UPI0007C515C4|nr:SUKH-4 family immunity protein [Streptomyces sp. RTd22]